MTKQSEKKRKAENDEQQPSKCEAETSGERVNKTCSFKVAGRKPFISIPKGWMTEVRIRKGGYREDCSSASNSVEVEAGPEMNPCEFYSNFAGGFSVAARPRSKGIRLPKTNHSALPSNPFRPIAPIVPHRAFASMTADKHTAPLPSYPPPSLRLTPHLESDRFTALLKRVQSINILKRVQSISLPGLSKGIYYRESKERITVTYMPGLSL